MQSAKIFDARCEDVARLMNEAAARLAAQADLILKMLHEATAMVEDMQRKAVNTAQMVASDEAVPDGAVSGGTSGNSVTEGISCPNALVPDIDPDAHRIR